MVQDEDCDGDQNEQSNGELKDTKLVLLDPDKVYNPNYNPTDADIANDLQSTFPGLSPELLNLLTMYHATPGPTLSLTINSTQLPTSHLLSLLLPPEALPPPTSFEVIGHVLHLNLRAPHLPHKHIIGQALLHKFSPAITTVINKVGQVHGLHRTYDMELLAGTPNYDVTVVEHGLTLQFDVRNVYWCSRLAGERTRMIREEIEPNQVVADAFCGVGAVCVVAAKMKECTVWANNWNPYAVEYCRKNAIRNGILQGGTEDKKQMGAFVVTGEDARDFIRSLGNRRRWVQSETDNEKQASGVPPKVRRGVNVRSKKLQAKQRQLFSVVDLPHHLIMNYPLDAPSFLDQLRWWPTDAKVTTKVHVYTFAREDVATGRDAETVAVDLVAENLLPQGGAMDLTMNRWQELDALGCEVQVREIRDVAPGKVVMCVSFKATRMLIGNMQGDFVDVPPIGNDGS